MNKCIFLGRLANDPEISSYNNAIAGTTESIAKYRLAINKRAAKGEKEADYISVVAFKANAAFAEKYLKKGMQIMLVSHVVTGNYVNKDGVKIYTTDFIAESQEFTETKKTVESRQNSQVFVKIDDNEEVPFD